jgi:SRSO17 transposase
VAFATKPQLAQKMIARAMTAEVPFAWVAGDEVYGGNPGLRSWLEEEGHLLRDDRRMQRDDRRPGGTVPR